MSQETGNSMAALVSTRHTNLAPGRFVPITWENRHTPRVSTRHTIFAPGRIIPITWENRPRKAKDLDAFIVLSTNFDKNGFYCKIVPAYRTTKATSTENGRGNEAHLNNLEISDGLHARLIALEMRPNRSLCDEKRRYDLSDDVGSLDYGILELLREKIAEREDFLADEGDKEISEEEDVWQALSNVYTGVCTKQRHSSTRYTLPKIAGIVVASGLAVAALSYFMGN